MPLTQFLQQFCFQPSRSISLLNAKTKGRDAVKQPEGFDRKLLVFKEKISVTGDIQGDCSAWLLLRMERTALCCHLGRQERCQYSSEKNSIQVDKIQNVNAQVETAITGELRRYAQTCTSASQRRHISNNLHTDVF